MAVKFGPQAEGAKTSRKHARKAEAPLIPLDQPGRVRIKHLQALFCCSHQTIYNRIEQGLLPEPDGHDLPNRPKGKRGRPYWCNATILPFLKPSK